MHRHDLSDTTVAVTSGRPDRVPGGPLNTPITMASALIPGGESEYGRHGNPAWKPFEAVLGDLEGGQALAFASGTAASAALFELVPIGAAVVVPRHAYYGTLHQLREKVRKQQIELRVVDIENTAEVIAASTDAALLWIESPTNPALEIADIEAIGAALEPHATAIAVDNTFATPLRQKPLELGADFVIHSASKILSGHSDLILGAIISKNGDRSHQALEATRKSLGAIPGALECWLAVRGIRTLHVRLDRAESNARELHQRLSKSTKVSVSRYPGYSTIIAFDVAAGSEAAQRVTESSELITYATSLGGVETTWERRRRHTGEPDSIPDSLIRLSVGIEDVEDLWNDICHALDSAST